MAEADPAGEDPYEDMLLALLLSQSNLVATLAKFAEASGTPRELLSAAMNDYLDANDRAIASERVRRMFRDQLQWLADRYDPRNPA